MRSLVLGLLLVGLTTATYLGGTKEIITVPKRHHVLDEYYNKGSSLKTGDVFTKEENPTFRIEVNEEEINEIIDEFKDFGERYITRTKAERIALMRKLKQAFKNTAAKLLLNFGSTIPPVVKSWAELMKHVQVNDACDQECAVKCLDPLAGCDNMYFNRQCLSSCRCKFDIDSIEPSRIRMKMDEVTRKGENVNRFFKDINVENMKLLKPSFDAYMKKASVLHHEFAELLREHVPKIFGVDETCLEDCLDPSFVSYWEIPTCVKHCKTGEGLITIEQEGGSDLGSIFGVGHHEYEREFLPIHRRGIMNRRGGVFEDVENVSPYVLEKEKLLKKKHGGLTSLFGIHRDYEDYEDEDEILGVKKPLVGERGSHLVTRKRKSDFNLPELMKYSDYDKKAWSFFRRYQDDIDI